MTLKTSLFNAGIYKSTVKRNIWGSVIYFIILFLLTPMPLIANLENKNNRLFTSDMAVVYRESSILPAIIVTIAVTAIVAMVVFRFMHSKKAAVFMHSLPVCRTAVFLSTLAAAFTLMAVPVIATGVILAILSLTAYSANTGLIHCAVWVGVLLVCQFVMFSVATFASVITGNSFASPVLNLLIHLFPVLTTACISLIAEHFLFGYSNQSDFVNGIIESNPAVWICGIGARLNDGIPLVLIKKMPWYIVISLTFYIVSWILYKRRAMEKAEDVAAFNILNPIFKYSITFLGTLSAYAIFSFMIYESTLMYVFAVALIGAIIYFVCEMVLKKTLKVWRAYKGLLWYAGAYLVMMILFVFTGFFGFESRVPDIDKIDKVAIYDYYYENLAYVKNEDVAEFARQTHKTILSGTKYTLVPEIYDTRIHIKYMLKNGKTITRAYQLSKEKIYEIMSGLYTYDDYVVANEAVFTDLPLNKIAFINSNMSITNKDKLNEFIACLREDTLNLDYGKIKIDIPHWRVNTELAFEVQNQEDIYADSTVPVSYHNEDNIILKHRNIKLNANYTKSIEWLIHNGYSAVFQTLSTPACIASIPDDIYTYDQQSYEKQVKANTIAIAQTQEQISQVCKYLSDMKIHSDNVHEYTYGIFNAEGKYYNCNVYLTKEYAGELAKLIN